MTTGTALRGTAITFVVVYFSLTSNCSAETPSGKRHSNACSRDAKTSGTTRSAMGRPGHCLLPAPNGMNPNSFPLNPTISSSLSRNRSGMNSSGLSHAAASRIIDQVRNMTVQPLGTA